VLQQRRLCGGARERITGGRLDVDTVRDARRSHGRRSRGRSLFDAGIRRQAIVCEFAQCSRDAGPGQSPQRDEALRAACERRQERMVALSQRSRAQRFASARCDGEALRDARCGARRECRIQRNSDWA